MIGRGVVFCGVPITLVITYLSFRAFGKRVKETHDSTPLKYHSRYPLCVALLLFCGSLHAQDTVHYQCGYDYMNDTTITYNKNCTLDSTASTYTYYQRRWFGTVKKTGTKFTYFQTCTNDTLITRDSVAKFCDSIIPPVLVKNHLSGLAIRQQTWFNSTTPDTAWLNAMGGNIVLRISLSDLWPAEDSFDFSPIDTWITWAANMESMGVPIHYKLRVISGTFAPQWLRNAAGAFPIDSTGFGTLPGSGIASDSCIKFWSENAKAYNAILQNALAARYDTSRFINTVVITATGIGTGEPFEWATSSSGAGLTRRNQFIAAGATNANLQAAIASEIYADTVWKYTNVELCANPFQPVNPAAAVSIAITESYIDQGASLFGSRFSIGNNGLRTSAAPDGAKWAVPSGNMYLLEQYGLTKRATLGTKQYNQTASESQMGGYSYLKDVLNAGAINYKDILIELPDVERKIKLNLTNDDLKQFRNLLKSNL